MYLNQIRIKKGDLMNIKKLRKGQVVKNYKVLCSLLEEPELKADSKKAQLKKFSLYFRYNRDGQKYCIEEIYEKPKEPPKKNTNIEYVKIIELLILDELAQSKNNGEIFLSKNQTLKELKMINQNYAHYKTRTDKLNEVTNIPNKTIDDFYASANSTLKRNLEKALDSLRKKSLIIWSTGIKIHIINPMKDYNSDTGILDNVTKETVIDDNGEKHIQFKFKPGESEREATNEEKKYILRIERKVMLQLDCNDKKQLVDTGKWDIFKDKVNEILLKEKNISYYYDCYKILFNKDQVIEGYMYCLKFLMEDAERNENQNLLNKDVAKRLLNNANNRYKKANVEKKKTLNPTEKIRRRSKKKYVNDNKKLIKLLINKSTKSIENKGI